jgi:hypothetical protein
MTGVRIEMVAQDYALAAQIVSPSGSPVPVNSFGLLGQHAVVASTGKIAPFVFACIFIITLILTS